MRIPSMNEMRSRGFTLMELLMVLGLLGLLAGMTAPALRGVREWLSGRESRLLFMELETACRLYRMENGSWPESLTGREVRLDADPVDWRTILGPYLERAVLDVTLTDGHGNPDIRLVLDADGDHWIEGDELRGLPEPDRPRRIWTLVALYSLDHDGNVSATNWETD